MNARYNHKAVVMITVIGIMLMISSLAVAALTIMSQQSRVNEGKIKRMRTRYAIQAGIVHGMELMSKGTFPAAGTSITIGNGIPGYPPGGIQVSITAQSGAACDGPNGSCRVSATASY